jgi:hypothetical protein
MLVTFFAEVCRWVEEVFNVRTVATLAREEVV